MNLCDYGCCPREVLDLFCGAGGAAMGLHRAWPDAEIVGVDIKPQLRYPFRFVQADAMTFPLDGYDFIWASPPCQAYTSLLHLRKTVTSSPDLVDAVRRRLPIHVPWVMENVVGSPIQHHITLCGAMFDGLRTYRHRRFESNYLLMCPPHPQHKIRSHGIEAHMRAGWEAGLFVTVRNHSSYDICAEAMGIDWVKDAAVTQAIPPAYSEYIARQLTPAILAA